MVITDNSIKLATLRDPQAILELAPRILPLLLFDPVTISKSVISEYEMKK